MIPSMSPLVYLKLGAAAIVLVIISWSGYAIYSRGNTIDALKVENTQLTERLLTQDILLTDLNTKTNIMKADLKIAQETSQKVRVVTAVKVRKIYQASIPEDCPGSVDYLTNQMQQTLKGRTK